MGVITPLLFFIFRASFSQLWTALSFFFFFLQRRKLVLLKKDHCPLSDLSPFMYYLCSSLDTHTHTHTLDRNERPFTDVSHYLRFFLFLYLLNGTANSFFFLLFFSVKIGKTTILCSVFAVRASRLLPRMRRRSCLRGTR